MNLIVTGAAGYLGSTLTIRLAASGHHVIAVDNNERRMKHLAEAARSLSSIEFCDWSLEDLARSRALLSDAEAIVHLAGVSSDAEAERDPALTRHANVDLAVELARAAKAAGIGTFLLASTVAIYQVPVGHRLEHEILAEDDQPPLREPLGVYAQSKLAAEQALAALADEHFTVRVLRKGSLYGHSPVMRWDLIINRAARDAWSGNTVVLHDLGAVWRPIAHVEDAARAYIHLLELRTDPGQGAPFNLVERNVRLSEVCLEIDSLLQRTWGRGIVLSHSRGPCPQRTGRVSGESLRRVGWQPRWTLREGISELLWRLETRQVEARAGEPGTSAPQRATSDAGDE